MDVQQDINLGIIDAFEELGVNFAYPSRTVYIASDPGKDGLVNDSKHPA
jgi:small-conductance mechanosensitive channel